jgi:hypothetical protein
MKTRIDSSKHAFTQVPPGRRVVPETTPAVKPAVAPAPSPTPVLPAAEKKAEK